MQAAAVPMIGPNALTQTAAALRALGGEEIAVRVFLHAGLLDRLATPPDAMVPAAEALRLMASLGATLPPALAEAVAREAGRRTADYLLDHRIPPLAQTLLRRLPRRLAAWALGRAIAAHAWTFAGGAPVRVRAWAGGAVIEIKDEADPLTQIWRGAVLARLYAALVAPGAKASHAGSRHSIVLS